MKIISSFKDYYDGFDFDKDKEDFLIYYRYTENYDINEERRGLSKQELELKNIYNSIWGIERFHVYGQFPLWQRNFYCFIPDNWKDEIDEHIILANGDSDIANLNRKSDPACWLYTGRYPRSAGNAFIFFCGRMYIAREAQISYRKGDLLKTDTHYAYTLNQYFNLIKKKVSIESKPGEDISLKKESVFSDMAHMCGEALLGPNADKVMSFPADIKIFEYFKSPIVIFDGAESSRRQLTATVNANLSKYEFFRALPQNLCYQEVELFIGNQLSHLNRIEPKPITDQLRAETHGFDKNSFKNIKGGREKLDRSKW